jgi:hypothetical protein
MFKNKYFKMSLYSSNIHIIIFVILIPLFGFKNNIPNNSKALKTTKARMAVEKAWDTYHDGALGGTLPSPEIQTNLETKLHRCRELLAEAYEAEDSGNTQKTKQLIVKILALSNNVITESQVPKK